MNKLTCLFAVASLLFGCCRGGSFDCPPARGTPCTSVSDLEEMIVEREQGSDLFCPNLSTRERLRREELSRGQNEGFLPSVPLSERIWEFPQKEGDHIRQGHYIYRDSDS